MQKFQSGHGRLIVAFALAGTLALLAACGGGGGGSSTPPVVTPPSGNLTGTAGGVIADNASSGTATIVWHVDNAVSPKVVVGGATLSTAASGNQSVTLGHGPTTVSLSDGTLSLSSLSISMDCVSPAAWDGNACTRPAKLGYDNVHVAVRYHFLGLIDAAGQFVQAANNSTHAVGNFKRVDGVYIAEEPLAGSCLYPALSRMTNDSKYYVVAYNPVTNAFADYTGTLPAGYEYANDSNGGLSVVGAKWHRFQRFDPAGKADWGTPPFDYMAAWTTDSKGGYYYASRSDPRELHNLLADGKDIVTYPAQADNGTFMVMNTITCH
jgi:hypothetical protein